MLLLTKEINLSFIIIFYNLDFHFFPFRSIIWNHSEIKKKKKEPTIYTINLKKKIGL